MVFAQVIIAVAISSAYALGGMMGGGMKDGKTEDGMMGTGMMGFMGNGMMKKNMQPVEKYPPKPYQFGYQANDQMGNNHYRKEQGDGAGNVRGSYGYTDDQGLYRTVVYVAGADGYKARVFTNEPGTLDISKKENPAHVQLFVEPPPQGVVTKYLNNGAYGMKGGMTASGHSGMGAGMKHGMGMGMAVGGMGVNMGRPSGMGKEIGFAMGNGPCAIGMGQCGIGGVTNGGQGKGFGGMMGGINDGIGKEFGGMPGGLFSGMYGSSFAGIPSGGMSKGY